MVLPYLLRSPDIYRECANSTPGLPDSEEVKIVIVSESFLPSTQRRDEFRDLGGPTPTGFSAMTSRLLPRLDPVQSLRASQFMSFPASALG